MLKTKAIAAIWVGNVASAVILTFVNKFLMVTEGFKFVTTLSALHFASSAIVMWIISQNRNGDEPLVKPNTPVSGHKSDSPRVLDTFSKEIILFAAIANASIISMNASLLLNPISFYQISKLAVVPSVAAFEVAFMSRQLTSGLAGSIILVLAGVAAVTVSDLNLHITMAGLMVAITCVVCSGGQQLMARHLQVTTNISPEQLLMKTAALQAGGLLLMSPFLDHLISGQWVHQYNLTSHGLGLVVLSCAIAVMVNMTQFMCLGKFSALSYQVMGHTKTVLILLGGWAWFNDVIGPKKGVGMLIAIAGMVWYARLSSAPKPTLPTSTNKETADMDEGVPLIKVTSSEGMTSRQ